jgi:hypothetical protein
MRFHLFGLANIPTRKENTYEPMTPLVYNMAKMLKDHGHHVIFYGAAGSNPPCDEFVEVVPQELLPSGLVMGEFGVPQAAWNNDWNSPTWQSFINVGRQELRKRYITGDISLISFGQYQRFVAEESQLACEFICGYSGIFHTHKVFPSSAWMHYLYGVLQYERCPPWTDVVIPHYLDLDDFPYTPTKQDYLLCLGRIDKDKGTDIAIDIANRTGMKIVVAGVDMVTHDIPDWVKYLPGNVEFTGYVNTEKRLELLRNAKALIHPCRWLEPFGMVLIEAQACGTPVICSDWGALTEVVQHGHTGYCCRDMLEFTQAVKMIDQITPINCRSWVESNYNLETAYNRYLRYFFRLQKHLGGGWYETKGLWRGPDLIRHLRDRLNRTITGVEVGVDRGALSGFLLAELPQLQLHLVDTWSVFPEDSNYSKSEDGIVARTQEQRDEDFNETIRVTDHAKDRRTILKCLSNEAVKSFEDNSLDFVFIDADHSYEGVVEDLHLWTPKVKLGGLICGHDINMEGWFPKWGVTKAVTEFAINNNFRLDTGADYTWFMEKTHG